MNVEDSSFVLKAHADLFHDMTRRGILRSAKANDAIKGMRFKAIPKASCRDFCSQTPTPEGLINEIDKFRDPLK
jgi:hypothetical protein